MIKTTDLRLGNLILDEFRDIRTVSGFHTGYILLECPNPPQQNDVNPADADGIPLDEDWLKQFGFVHKNGEGNYGFWLGDFVINTTIDNEKFCMYFNWKHEYYGGNTPVLLPYVHQLQNLYRSLTGKELECDPSLKLKTWFEISQIHYNSRLGGSLIV